MFSEGIRKFLNCLLGRLCQSQSFTLALKVIGCSTLVIFPLMQAYSVQLGWIEMTDVVVSVISPEIG